MNYLNDPNAQELLNCLRNYLRRYEFTGKAYEIFKVLTDLTIERLEKGEDLKIQSTALQVGVYGKLKDNSPGSTLATPWKTLLDKILPEREIGLQEFFAQNGFDKYLWPQKDKSPGGSGNTSIYYLVTRDIPNTCEENDNSSLIMQGDIRYIPEITPNPAWWLKKLLAGGYALHGWRRSALVILTTISFVTVVLLLGLIFIAIVYTKSLSLQSAISLIFSAIAISWVGYSYLSPLFRLLQWRMIEAPAILVALREGNVLIELVSEQQESGEKFKVIRLVRYAGACPICKGKIEVVAGKKEFPNRFVGRCVESPAEHVYSFDRVLLNGKLLRQIKTDHYLHVATY